jgi:hypothetical protein
VTAALAATGGFLLAVLWMDLMFDTQARGGGAELDQRVRDSISAYYLRATTTSQPMGAMVAVVMVLLLAALGLEAVHGDSPRWLIGASVVLAGGPIALSLLRTVPNAVKLGRQAGSAAEQSRLARAVLRDHIVCAVGISLFVVLWVTQSVT